MTSCETSTTRPTFEDILEIVDDSRTITKVMMMIREPEIWMQKNGIPRKTI